MGNSFGGVLYAVLAGPVFFVINGVCFIYSAITEVFIRIPYKKRTSESRNIRQEMIEGSGIHGVSRALKYFL